MDVSARAGFPASPSGNSSPVQSSDRQLADQLVNAAEKGDSHKVIRAVAANGLNILSTHHSETGNTALHVAIKNSHVEVVGAITGLLVNPDPNPSSSVSLQTLLALQNNESQSPLEVGDITPEIKTELLAGLSDLWLFCGRHNGYMVIPYQQKACGCRVCELCAQTPQTDYVTCTNCPRYLRKDDTFKDTGMLREVKNQIKKYQVLFEGEGIPACPGDCQSKSLAYPPFESQCGHVLCYNCVSRAEQTCQATIDGSDKKCQQPLKAMRMDEDASKLFIGLFSSKTQYDDDSVIGQSIQEVTHRPRTPAVQKIKAIPWTDPFQHLPEVITHVINGIITETCRCFPHRYAVPKKDRILKTYYYDDPLKNLKIEELEYRLEFSPDRIREKLETARTNARTQQEAEQKAAEQKAAEQRVIARPTADDEPLTPPDDAEQQETSGSSLECLLRELDAKLATLSDSTTGELETERAIAHEQQAEQEATAQEVAEIPADSDIEIISLPDEPVQQEASESLLESLLRELDAMSETLPGHTTGEVETDQTIARTQHEAEPEATVQDVAESTVDSDIEIISQSDESAQPEGSDRSLALPPRAPFVMSDRLSVRITAMLEAAPTATHTQQAAEHIPTEQQVTEHRVTAYPSDDEDIDILTLPDESAQWEASGSSLESGPPVPFAMPDTEPDPTTAIPECAEAFTHTQQEATEQPATSQHVIAQPTGDDEGTLALSSYDFGQWLASSRSWGMRPSISYAMPEILSAPFTAPETEPTNAQTLQQAHHDATEQYEMEQSVEGIERLVLSDDADSLTSSGSSWGMLPSISYAMPETLSAPFTAAPETEPPNAQTQQQAHHDATEQHEIEQSIDDIETLALSADDDASLASSGSSWGTLSPESNAILETLPDPITAMLGTAPAVTQTQQEAPEQHVIAQPADDTELPALSDDSDPLEAIDSWQPLLPPVTCEMSETLPGVSIASSIGWRPTMEDAHIVTDFTIKAGGEDVPIQILGVFDGHGTKAVADHAAQYIVKFLTKWLELYNTEGLTDEGIWNAIKIALVDLSRSSHCALGGSTACVALIIKNDLWVSNLGDSRAILVNRNGEDIQLSEDAKPENKIYKHSIKKRGGFVEFSLGCHRVNGELAPARALADHQLDGAVSSRAKITRYPLTSFSGCLVLACDGVTDVLTTKNIGDITRVALSEDDPTVNIADRIAKESLRKGTTDNVSAVVAPLGGA
ncbi:protein phosphatase 2C domain-containing protein [Kistimonas asteriae]|uniref:protein phosphatase 2C domain-containing protein n=1 Tax=Kistimonas asteriae TaxID=517724 RepID=UPI001BA6BFDB|nr:protein phosphatase 2C domain-containing protein [Kistimonas asteriae]